MKSPLLSVLLASLLCIPADADDVSPNFLKIGDTYHIRTAASGYTPEGTSLPSPVTILAHAGGSWFLVAYREGVKPNERTAKQWINFAHISSVSEAPADRLPELAPRVPK